MNTAVISTPQEPGFTTKELELAEKSMRQAHNAIRLNVGCFAALMGLWFLKKHPTGAQLYSLLSGTALYFLITLWQWNWVKKYKFRRAKAYHYRTPLILTRRRFKLFWFCSSAPWNVVLLISLVILCAYEDFSNLLHSVPWLIFWSVVWNLPAFMDEKIEVGTESLKIVQRFTRRRRKTFYDVYEQNDIACEIPYVQIDKVTCSGTGSLLIHSSESIPASIHSLPVDDNFLSATYPYMPIIFLVDAYGAHATATVLDAIERHAPQAMFDTGADLMRRGYFSW